MRSARISRYSSSTFAPLVTPMPPCICTAASMTFCASSVAWSLAIAAARRLSRLRSSCCQAPRADQQRGRVDRERHVGQLCLSDRIVGERARSQSPLAREIDRLNQRSSGQPERRCADRHPEQVERLHRDLEAFAGLADHRIRWHPDIVIFQARERVRGDDLDPFLDAEAASSAGTMKADKPARSFALAGPSEGDVEVGDPAVGDVGLLADEHAILPSHSAADAAMLAASEPASGSVMREGGNGLAVCDVRQPFATSARSVPNSRIAPDPRPCIAKAKSARPE